MPNLLILSVVTLALQVVVPLSSHVTEPTITEYTLVVLRSGPGEASGQAAHLAHFAKLYRDGVALFYGFVTDQSDVREVAVLNMTNPEAVRREFSRDPLIQSQYFQLEQHRWFSSVEFGRMSMPRTPDRMTLAIVRIAAGRSDSGECSLALKPNNLLAQGTLDAVTPTKWVLMLAPETGDGARRELRRSPDIESGRCLVEVHPMFAWEGQLKKHKAGQLR